MKPLKHRWISALGGSLLLHGLFLAFLAAALPFFLSAPAVQGPIEAEIVTGSGGRTGKGSSPEIGKAGRASPSALQENSPSAAEIPASPASGTAEGNEDFPAAGASSYGEGGTAGGGETGTGSGGGDSTGEGSGSGGTGETAGPQILSAPAPVYPESARQSGISGTVLVGLAINEAGTVSDAWVESSSGNDALDRAAVQAVLSWQFIPARQNGLPVPVRTRVPVIFGLRQ